MASRKFEMFLYSSSRGLNCVLLFEMGAIDTEEFSSIERTSLGAGELRGTASPTIRGLGKCCSEGPSGSGLVTKWYVKSPEFVYNLTRLLVDDRTQTFVDNHAHYFDNTQSHGFVDTSSPGAASLVSTE